MKLLLDHNLSYKLAFILRDEYPGTIAIREIGLSTAADSEVWSFARAHEFVVITKDSDFLRRSFLLGAPPQVIWIATGNCSTNQILDLLRANTARIRAFEVERSAALLILY